MRALGWRPFGLLPFNLFPFNGRAWRSGAITTVAIGLLTMPSSNSIDGLKTP